MITYLIQKTLFLIGALLLVATFTFFAMHAIPGDPFTDEQALPSQVHDALRRHYHLDEPLYRQYGHYLFSLLQGELGPSLKYPNRTVNQIIRETLPISAVLACQALALAIGLSSLLGTIAALKHKTWVDYSILFATVIGLSFPSFILATLLQYLFAMHWTLFPVARWESWSHTFLPTCALAALPTAFMTRLIRSSLAETLEQDFIKMARAKGLSFQKILIKHALRYAYLPVLTYLGPLTANILVGSFIIEKIFSIPGLGQWFVHSIGNRDYSVIMGLTLFYSFLLMMAVWIVDVLSSYVDPRIKLRSSN